MKTKVIFISLLLSACNPARMSTTLERMTVLAIQAEPASAVPGDTVTLTALAVTGKQDETVDLVWYLCQHESLDDCVKADDLIQIGAGPTASVTVPLDAFEGDSFVVWLDATFGGAYERNLKAIPVRAATHPRNHNPILDRVKWGEATAGPITARRDERVPVRVGSSQVMNELHDDSGEPAAEEVQLRTFTTGGTLVDPSGTGASAMMHFRAPKDQDGTFGAWVVANDGRGGVAWTEQWFVVDGDAE